MTFLQLWWNVVRLGRMTALQKPDGGVRGIVVGDVLRRLVERTIAQQLMPAVERYHSTVSVCVEDSSRHRECVAHVLQGLTEDDPNATVLSIDGISAYDLISCRAILEALRRVPGGDQVLPFVRLFYDRHSTYLWEDDAGTVHHIVQGEGGEQGDPLMPLLFALGQHGALQAVQDSLGPTERLLAFQDDVHGEPERIAHSFATPTQTSEFTSG